MRFVIQEMNNRTYYCDGEATREDTLKGASETASSVPNGVQVSSAPLAKYSSAYYFAESARMSNLVRASDNVTGFGNHSVTGRQPIVSPLELFRNTHVREVHGRRVDLSLDHSAYIPDRRPRLRKIRVVRLRFVQGREHTET